MSIRSMFANAVVTIALVGASLPAAAQGDLVNRGTSEVTHNTWTSGTAMPTAVLEATAAVIKNDIYVVGGENSSQTIVADVQIYNPGANTWTTGISYPTGIVAASAAVVANVLYVFGGTSDGVNPTNAVWAYNPKTKSWSAMTAMPTARWATEAVVEKNIIYVIGGVVNGSGNGSITTVESYNPATNSWNEEAPLLVAQSQSSAGLLGTKIVVADGFVNGGGTTSNTEAYDAATNSWTTLAADPAGDRGASCFGAIGPKLYAVGGQPASTYADDFQLSKDKWTTLASIPQSTIFPASAVYKKQLYCFGGWSSWEGSITNNVQIYQP
ncbi:MAG: kelch repeat-containing protein [Terriglobales bacterium]